MDTLLSKGINTRKRPVNEIWVEILGPLVEIGSLVICSKTISSLAIILSTVPFLSISGWISKFLKLLEVCFLLT